MDQPRAGPPSSRPASVRVVQLGRQFAAALAESGDSPQIEDYLDVVDRSERPSLLSELLPIEIVYRHGRGENCSAEGYRQRFPKFDALVTTICSSADQLSPAGRKPASPPSTEPTSDVVPVSQFEGEDDSPSGDADSFLGTTWPFSELPRPVTEALRAEMHTRDYAAGEELIRQGEPSRGLVAIMEGTIDVRVRDAGQWRDVAETKGVTVLGEMGLVTETPCTATVVAKTPVRALVLPAERFRKLAARHNVLWVALSRLVAERLGRVEVDVLAGKVLEGYRIKRAVGRGGMAVVYEAQRLEDGRQVALKMMSHRYTHDLETQRRFEREVSICRSLEHPNISRIHSCFTSFGTNFMVMEFCDGATLGELVRRHGALPQPQVRNIVGQLAAALDYAHRHGVCHRDLKPSNAMLDRQGCLKLMDFGLAKTSESPDLTRLGSVLGTPRYMAPEQLAGKRVDRRADLFAFGCIVCEMLTGKPLFRGRDVLAIIVGQMQWSLPPAEELREGLDEELYRVLEETLAKEPEGRVLELSRLLPWAEKGVRNLLS